MSPTSQPTPGRVGMAAHLSAARLQPYLARTGGNTVQALRLYRWNTELSGALYEVLHNTEVVLRNALDEALHEWNEAQGYGREWLSQPAPVIERIIGAGRLAKISKDAGRAVGGRARTHDDLVAACSLGTWVTLLPGSGRDAGKVLLWNQAFAQVFVHRTGTARELTEEAHALLRLRNRVAHMEPVFQWDRTRRGFEAARSIVAAIDPAAAAWVWATQRVTTVRDASPRPPSAAS